MAIVNNIAQAPSPMQVLERAPFDVYLGGSRRAAQLAGLWVNGVQTLTPYEQQYQINISASTDYDFYTTYNSYVEKYLRDFGFTDTEHSNKCTAFRDVDGMLVTSEHTFPYALDSEAVRILERDNVQIVLRADAEFYRTVFESIPTEFYYNHLWKSSPACVKREHIQPIFNALFAVAHEAQAVQKQQ
jgi:hypothetical protein